MDSFLQMDYDKNSEALILCANCKAMDKIDTVENNLCGYLSLNALIATLEIRS